MANILPKDKQVAVNGGFADGNGIRQIERIAGFHRDTITRLGALIGQGCAALLITKMRGLTCQHVQFDEIWGFIGKKEKHVRPGDSPDYGDVWTFSAIDANTKVVPTFRVGRRDAVTANAFVEDVSSRLGNRVQISSDAHHACVEAVELSFGAGVDFAQIIKTYEVDDSSTTEWKYSPSKAVSVEKRPIAGNPDTRVASTSYVD